MPEPVQYVNSEPVPQGNQAQRDYAEKIASQYPHVAKKLEKHFKDSDSVEVKIPHTPIVVPHKDVHVEVRDETSDAHAEA